MLQQNEVLMLTKEMKKSFSSVYSKYYTMREVHKAKLCQAKQKIEDEITWRDEKIKTLQRELSLCSLSLAKVRMQLCSPQLKGSWRDGNILSI